MKDKNFQDCEINSTGTPEPTMSRGMDAVKVTPPQSSSIKKEAEDSSTSDDVIPSDKEMSTANPHDNDVLCGRGGSINTHPGNETFRRFVERRKRIYLTARFKREKRLIASSVVKEIRELNPPGRFLSRDAKTGIWHDIGDEKARDKTSQALRENAPTIRKEIEIENDAKREEMRRQEEEEEYHRRREANYSAQEHYHYGNYHSGQGYYAPSYDEYDDHYDYNEHYNNNGYQNAPQPHDDSYCMDYDYTGAAHPPVDKTDEYYSSHRGWRKPTPDFHRPPQHPREPHLPAVPPSNLRTSSPYSQPNRNPHTRGGRPVGFQHPNKTTRCPSRDRMGHRSHNSWQHGDQRYDTSRRRPNNHPDATMHQYDSPVDDEVEDRWQVDYEEGVDLPNAPSSSSTAVSVFHHLPHRRTNEQTPRNCLSNNSKNNPRESYRKNQLETPNLLERTDSDEKSTNGSILSNFAKNVLSWESNTGAPVQEQEAKKKAIDEGQEVELITIMESMSVDEDPHNQQQGDRKKMRMSRDRSFEKAAAQSKDVALLKQNNEIQTKPSQEEEDWSSKVSGCHTWIKDSLNAVSLFKEDSEIGIGISPVHSIDMDGVSICGADLGVSLCNVFESDIALQGGDAPIPLPHNGNSQSMAVTNHTSEKTRERTDMQMVTSSYSQDSLQFSDIAPYSVTEVDFASPKPDMIESAPSKEKSEASFSSNFAFFWDGKAGNK